MVLLTKVISIFFSIPSVFPLLNTHRSLGLQSARVPPLAEQNLRCPYDQLRRHPTICDYPHDMHPISPLFQVHVQTPIFDFCADFQELPSWAQIVFLVYLFDEVGESRGVGAVDKSDWAGGSSKRGFENKASLRLLGDRCFGRRQAALLPGFDLEVVCGGGGGGARLRYHCTKSLPRRNCVRRCLADFGL